ncbi:MAG: DNA-binding protein WhiA [Clostridia bacterium]|nr:DNA-binding protein WhiA [Clostridia bacterium]
MSYSLQIKEQLFKDKPRKSCCQSAFLAGMLSDAAVTYDNDISVSFLLREASEWVRKQIVPKQEGTGSICERHYLGRTVFTVAASSPKGAEIASNAADLQRIESLFRCDTCSGSFLRGMFIACGNLSDPAKQNQLDFFFHGEDVAMAVSELLASHGLEPQILKRKNGYNVYLKRKNDIQDFLLLVGCGSVAYGLIDTQFEQELKNREQRATNCVARNIESSIRASSSIRSAITYLTDVDLIRQLPEELVETANLRMEYPDLNLAELAAVHKPPLTKSGLNHRLSKIEVYAKKRGWKKQ